MSFLGFRIELSVEGNKANVWFNISVTSSFFVIEDARVLQIYKFDSVCVFGAVDVVCDTLTFY